LPRELAANGWRWRKDRKVGGAPVDLVGVVAHECDPGIGLGERSGRVRRLAEDRRAEDEERVKWLELVAEPRAIRRQDAGIEPVVLSEPGASAERFLKDRRHEPLGELGDRRPGLSAICAGADDERGCLRSLEERDELLDSSGVGGRGTYDPLRRRVLTLRVGASAPVVHRDDHNRRPAMRGRLVSGAPDRARDVLRAHGLIDPYRILAGEPLQPPGEKRRVREVPPVLLADQHDERSSVDPCGCERADSVPEAGRRVQEHECGLFAADCPPGCETDHGRLVEGEHEAKVLRKVGEKRHFGRAGIPEDRGQPLRPENVVGRVADRAETALLAHAAGSIPQLRSSV
jgi:hypothetical protein